MAESSGYPVTFSQSRSLVARQYCQTANEMQPLMWISRKPCTQRPAQNDVIMLIVVAIC